MSTLVGATTVGKESTCKSHDKTSVRSETRKRKRDSGRAAMMAHSAFDVLFPSPEIVLEEDIQYTTEAKGRLDDVWGEFANWGRSETQQCLFSRPTWRPMKLDALDCLNVLRSIVTTSGVRVSSLPSGVVTMVDLMPFRKWL